MKNEAIQTNTIQLPNLTRMNILSIFLGVLFIGGILFLSAYEFPNSITFRSFGVNDVTQLLTVLTLVSLFLERSLEVFINTWRGPVEERMNTAIDNAERVIAELKGTQKTTVEKSGQIMQTTGNEDPTQVTAAVAVKKIAEGPEEVTPELMAKLVELEGYQKQRTMFKSDTRKYALWTALVFGLLISGVGVRSLDSLVQPVAQSAVGFGNIQMFIFRLLDVLLTGGLIAGGSDGIHKITQLFSTYFEESRNKLQDKPFSG